MRSMRVAVIMVWRPKNFPQWQGRSSVKTDRIPASLAYNRTAAPYTAVHIASLLPSSWDVQVVHEEIRDADIHMDVDAVFLSTMDFCAPRARRLAREFRARGIKVIVGGLYPSLNPAYFAGSADAVVVGEAEPVMPRLIRDLEAGRLESEYRAGGPADLRDLPVPRYDLVETEFAFPMGYEVTRGCPFTCSFCVLSALRQPYRHRPIQHVLRDIQAIPANWTWRQRKIITFWDNNLGADRKFFRELCQALTPLKRYWATQTSLDTINEESARLMGKAGCRYVYIGLESLSSESLAKANKRHNKIDEYRQRIDCLHRNGIVVMSIFLLGLDGDTPDTSRRCRISSTTSVSISPSTPCRLRSRVPRSAPGSVTAAVSCRGISSTKVTRRTWCFVRTTCRRTTWNWPWSTACGAATRSVASLDAWHEGSGTDGSRR